MAGEKRKAKPQNGKDGEPRCPARERPSNGRGILRWHRGFDQAEGHVVHTFTAMLPDGTLILGRLALALTPEAAWSGDRKRHSKERAAMARAVLSAWRAFGRNLGAAPPGLSANPYGRSALGSLSVRRV